VVGTKVDLKKLSIACFVPTLLLVVLDIFDIVINFSLSKTSLCIIPFIVAIGMFLLERLVQLYAGYAATKRYKLDIMGAILVSTFSGFVASIVSQLFLGVLVLTALMPPEALNPIGMSAPRWVEWAVSSIILIVINIVTGVVLGAIGGFIGQRK